MGQWNAWHCYSGKWLWGDAKVGRRLFSTVCTCCCCSFRAKVKLAETNHYAQHFPTRQQRKPHLQSNGRVRGETFREWDLAWCPYRWLFPDELKRILAVCLLGARQTLGQPHREGLPKAQWRVWFRRKQFFKGPLLSDRVAAREVQT